MGPEWPIVVNIHRYQSELEAAGSADFAGAAGFADKVELAATVAPLEVFASSSASVESDVLLSEEPLSPEEQSYLIAGKFQEWASTAEDSSPAFRDHLVHRAPRVRAGRPICLSRQLRSLRLGESNSLAIRHFLERSAAAAAELLGQLQVFFCSR